MRRGRELLSITAATALLLAHASAFAQTEGAPAAEALFGQGRAAMKAGQYDVACAKFRESERIDPAVGTKLSLAECEEKRGRTASAWELNEEVLKRLAAEDPRMPIARELQKKLQGRVPRVTLRLATGAPAATRARMGEVEFGGASLGVPLPIDPGKQKIVILAEGHEDRTIDVQLAEGEQREVEIAPGAAKSAPSPSDTPPGASSASAGRTAGWVLGGVGVAGIAAGAVTGILVLDQKGINSEHCPSSRHTCDQKGLDAAKAGKTLGVATSVSWAIGAASLAIGSYLLLTSDKNETTKTALVLGPGKAEVSFWKRW